MVQRILVSILSDSRLFREVLSTRLTQDSAFEPVAAANTVHGLLIKLRGRSVEILLVDVDADTKFLFSAGQVVWEIKTLLPATRVILLGFRDVSGPCADDAAGLRWIETGASGYLPCGAPYAKLRETICAVAEGRPTCSREVLLGAMQRIRTLAQATEAEGDHPLRQRLSDREAEIARLVRRGLANSKKIARELGLRPSTIDSHVQSILHKLRLKRRADLLRFDGEGEVD